MARKNPYMRGKMIEPLSFEGNEKVSDFIDNVFANSGFNARRLGEACELYSRMIDEDATVCLTLAGAMTPIGMGGPIIKMMENGFVDFIISTGANLYHDLHRTFGFPVVQGGANVDDDDLNKHGVARIYDTFIGDDETLVATDIAIRHSLLTREYESPISTAKLHRIIGEYVLKNAPHPEKSVLASAVKYGVPIYTSSPGDSSIGMNLVPAYLFGHGVPMDPVKDIIETTAIVREANKNGAVIVGGGSPKNFYMQTQPTLWQILLENRGGHDYFIQLTTDSPQWGGLSGATPQEAKSWGKVRDAKRNNVVVYSCASITFPLLCQYILSKKRPKKRKDIYAKRKDYVNRMSDVAKKNKTLLGALRKVLPRDLYQKVYED
ncbi:MAG: deoxyhypusine synthase [Candidatus Micrarchaeota archaeon]